MLFACEPREVERPVLGNASSSSLPMTLRFRPSWRVRVIIMVARCTWDRWLYEEMSRAEGEQVLEFTTTAAVSHST